MLAAHHTAQTASPMVCPGMGMRNTGLKYLIQQHRAPQNRHILSCFDMNSGQYMYNETVSRWNQTAF